MKESYLGVITVLLLFIICLFLSFFAYFIKDRIKPKKAEKPPQIFYISEQKKPKKKPKKKIKAIPLTGIIKAEDLKKYLEDKN